MEMKVEKKWRKSEINKNATKFDLKQNLKNEPFFPQEFWNNNLFKMLKNKLTSLFISLARIHFHQVPCFKIYFSHIPAFSNSLSHYYSYRHPFILVHFCPQISRNLNQISKFYHNCLHFSIICALYFVRMKLNSARSRKIRKKN